MAREKEKGLSKINNWINTEIYKEARKLSIDTETPFKELLERGLCLVLAEYGIEISIEKLNNKTKE